MTSVAFDVTPLLGVRTGIGRSVEEMAAALRQLPGGPRLVPYAFGRPAHRRALPDGARLVPVPARALMAAWSRTDHPRVDRWVRGAQVLHATAFVAPPSRLPTLVTVNDCAFHLHPDTVAGHVHAFDALLRQALKRGAHVHTPTQQVAVEVQELLGVELGARLHVVPYGVPRMEAVTGSEGGPPYVLVLGSLDPRKNVPGLVRAFGVLADPELRLVIAGPDGLGGPAVREAVAALPDGVRARVDVRGPVGEQERTRLLSGAAVLAYPSFYEGFGFPVLEAMAVGVPVLAADIPVLREVSQGAAVLADPHDVEALADGLRRAVAGTDLERARQVAAGYTWEATARGLVRAYGALSTSS